MIYHFAQEISFLGDLTLLALKRQDTCQLQVRATQKKNVQGNISYWEYFLITTEAMVLSGG